MTDTHENFPDHYTFSQRYGYELLPGPMRPGEISDDLRLEIWNTIYNLLTGNPAGLEGYIKPSMKNIARRTIGRFHKTTENSIPLDYQNIISAFELPIFNAEFNEVLDFLEIAIDELQDSNKFANRIKELFKKHGASYYLDTSKKPYWFVQSASKEQGEATEQAILSLHKNKMNGATEHLRKAAEHINSRQYADSIADSIHAVESVARAIDPKANKDLSSALNSLEKAGMLNHRALKEALKKLYGYASDEEGIRHALVFKDTANVGLDEAIFMFGACASFAAYLTQKHRQQAGKREPGAP